MKPRNVPRAPVVAAVVAVAVAAAATVAAVVAAAAVAAAAAAGATGEILGRLARPLDHRSKQGPRAQARGLCVYGASPILPRTPESCRQRRTRRSSWEDWTGTVLSVHAGRLVPGLLDPLLVGAVEDERLARR